MPTRGSTRKDQRARALRERNGGGRARLFRYRLRCEKGRRTKTRWLGAYPASGRMFAMSVKKVGCFISRSGGKPEGLQRVSKIKAGVIVFGGDQRKNMKILPGNIRNGKGRKISPLLKDLTFNN